MVGEIKRHFRDKGWAIRVPRALQELNGKMGPTIERLTARLGRSPSIAEIAAEFQTSPEQCRNSGWQNFGYFKNEGDCISFVATGGKNPPALPTATSTATLQHRRRMSITSNQPVGRQSSGAGSSIRLPNPAGTRETTTVTRSTLPSLRTT